MKTHALKRIVDTVRHALTIVLVAGRRLWSSRDGSPTTKKHPPEENYQAIRTDGGTNQRLLRNVVRLDSLHTAIGLVLALFLVPAIAVSGVVESELTGIAVKWGVAITLLSFVLWVESKTVSSIGLQYPRLIDLGWAILVAGAVIVMFVVTQPIISAFGLPTELGASMPSLGIGIASAITAGVTEEILFRGYPIERLIDGGYSPLGAGALTWLLFTIGHVGAGYPVGNLIQIGLAGLLITGFYVHLRSLFPVILGHVIVDSVGVFVYFFA